MKNHRIWLLIAALAGMLMLNGVLSLAAEHEHTLKVGKRGDITIAKEMKVGDLTLKPGHYIFQHREEAGDHFVRFTTPRDKNVGEVKCKLEPLSKKVERTTLYWNTEGGVTRLTKAEVGGENATHVF